MNRGYNKKLELIVIALWDALNATPEPESVPAPLLMAFLRLRQLEPGGIDALVKRLRHKHRELPRVRLMSEDKA